ncbi:MAG: phosphoglycerate mutase [Proteobacteria bacterium]|nr:phosphoglycerate mutase [Pseudomonadota bacterium]
MAQARATLLLPAARRFGTQALSAAGALALGRADRVEGLGAGRRAQLLRHFQLVPNHWPIAALTRQMDARDAAGAAWLRADPCRVLPDMNGARLLGYGDALDLDAEDARQLLPALKPLFGDAGFTLDAPVPWRWYLRLPREARLPVFTEPDEALGTDLFDHLAEGSEGRRWRLLASEAQVVLHNHPWNARRQAAGRPPVNSLWFWGGGVLPDHVLTPHQRVHGVEDLCAALAAAAGVRAALPVRFAVEADDALFDLTALRDLAVLDALWLQPALAALRAGELASLQLDDEDGTAVAFVRSQRWRFWRRPRARLDGG